jgi:hypothetical protein
MLRTGFMQISEDGGHMTLRASWGLGCFIAALFLQGIGAEATGFKFESVTSLDDMHNALRAATPLGTPRDEIRERFVDQGKATLYQHPKQSNIEKYVYDLDLCSLYVWRWNISANYDDSGGLTQIFVNGEPVHRAGDKPRQPKKKVGAKGQTMSKAWRKRPEAHKGEAAIAFVLYDLDTGSKDIDDEFVIGGGPTNADPRNPGKLHKYQGERWRTIFDKEPAKVVPHNDCG